MSESKSKIQVIDRAVSLLDALSSYDEPTSLKFLSADTGLHSSTTFRILTSLIEHGVVERTDSGNYRLGTRLLKWSDRVHTRLDLRTEARPIMEWLRDQIDETVNLTVREGDEVVYVERVTGRRTIRVEQVIGSHAPLHVTAVGKLMLGDMDEASVHEYAKRTGLIEFTENTLTTENDLKREVKKDIANGFALDNEEAEPGVGCIGAVIRDASGKVVAGLSVSAPIERRKPEWIASVVEAGRKISNRLGYHETRV